MREPKKRESSRSSSAVKPVAGARTTRPAAAATPAGGRNARARSSAAPATAPSRRATAATSRATRFLAPKPASRNTARPESRAARPPAQAAHDDVVARPVGPYESDEAGRAGEEQTIESSKYVSRAPRRFEEERFLFPQSYGVNKVRLLIRDPQWLFAHWDVDPRSFDELRHSMGERVVALSRLTLRVHDALSGGASVVLLPFGTRSWYVRADATRRSYRAELGVTLPSGEFRLLAESNTVVMPRQAPSLERARQTVRYGTAAASVAGSLPDAAAAAERASLAESGPWQAPPPREAAPSQPAGKPGAPALGGASDLFQPPAPGQASPAAGGASDVFRR